MPINTDKIAKELEKGTPEEQFEVYQTIKGLVQKALESQQQEIEKKNNEIQAKIDRISGNNY